WKGPKKGPEFYHAGLTKRPVFSIIPSLMSATHDTHSTANSDASEIAKFEAAAHRFWDLDGEFKPLHKLNPVRARYVQERTRLNGARGRRRHGDRSRAHDDRDRAVARARFGSAHRLPGRSGGRPGGAARAL